MFHSTYSLWSARRRGHKRRLRRLPCAELLERREQLSADVNGLALITSSKEPVDLFAQQQAYYQALDRISASPNYSLNSPLTTVASLDSTFGLHSRPSATKTIYLDFDGFTAISTQWSASANPIIVSPAWDPASNGPAFNNNELTQIQGIWQRVATDFLPFDVNVTTQEPDVSDLVNTGSGDDRWGIRVVFTPDDLPAPGAGGVAFINSFNWGYYTPNSTDTPCYVFNMSEVGAAGAASHEVGHALGLSHDGLLPDTVYYGGHGLGENGWGPIMGVGGYYRNVTTWDDGTYLNTTNGGTNANFGSGPDDLQIITTRNGFGYIPDAEADVFSSAQVLGNTSNYQSRFTNISQFGLISTSNDVDVFRFQTGTGKINLEFDPYVIETWVKASDGTLSSSIESVFHSTVWSSNQGTNLDLSASLFDSQGTLITTSNPDGMRARFVDLELTAGTYYVRLDGVGYGAPTQDPPSGYSDYASLGQYRITGTIPRAFGFLMPATPIVYTEDQDPVRVNTTSTTWFDSTVSNYSGAVLTITISPTPGNTDEIGFNPGLTGLSITDSNVRQGNQVIARLAQSPPTSLSFELNAQTNTSSIEALARSITFRALGDAPETKSRNIYFRLTKGTLAGDGAVPVTVIGTNDAPIMLPALLDSLTEDTLDSRGQTVAQFSSGFFRDPDPASSQSGIAIAGNTTPSSQGVWQVAFGTGNLWQNLPLVGPNNRLAISASTRLRFVPAKDFFGSVEPLMVQAIDNTYGGPFSTASNLHYLPNSAQGSQSPFSQVSSPLSIRINPVNDPPQATISDLLFAATQNERFSAMIPAGAIADIDDAEFNFTAAQPGGLPLPGWLSFDPKGNFSGTPGSTDVNDLQMVVFATDSGGLKASILVQIQVVNVNDPPEQLRFTGNKVSENASGIRVGQMLAFDPDGDKLRWTVLDNRFIVQDNELFIASPLDFENPAHRQVALTLRVEDSASPPQSTSLDVVVQLKDVNEFIPRLASVDYKVLDGSPAGTIIDTLHAVDEDVLQTVRYRLHSGDVTDFSIDRDSGRLSLNSPASIHDKTQYKVFVEAYDDGEIRFSSTAQFIVTVQQKNEHLPVFLANQELAFAENLAEGAVVGKIQVTDQDDNPLQYELLSLSGGNVNWLKIDSKTGQVSATGQSRFDFESSVSHNLQVRVTETIEDGRQVLGTVPLRILDANDPPTGLSMVSIYPNRQGAAALENWIVQDIDRKGYGGYLFSTTDPRFEIRNDKLALKQDQSIPHTSVGQVLTVSVLVTDNADPTSTAALVASVTVMDALAWQNPLNPLDVNRDGRVTATDSLLIVNRLNGTIEQSTLPQIRPFSSMSDPDYDVSGDNRLTSFDALLVINRLNKGSRGGEGELVDSSQPIAGSQLASNRFRESIWLTAYSQLEEESLRKNRRVP